MLTLEEAGFALRAIKLFSVLCIFPIGVDVKSGKIQRQSNKVKVCIWKILFSIEVAHCFYTFVRLIQSTVVEPEKYFRWDHFVLHYGCTAAAAVCNFTAFCLFVSNAEENVIIFNQLFSEREDPSKKIIDRLLEIQREKRSVNSNKSGQRENRATGNPQNGSKTRLVSTSASKSTSARETSKAGQNEVTEHKSELKIHRVPRPLLTWPPQYSLDELLAKIISLPAAFTAFCVVIILAVDPSRPQALFSALPPECQNFWSFLALLTVEALCTFIFCLAGGFAIGTQVLFFGKCHLEFKRINLQLRNFQEKLKNESLGIEIGIGGRDNGIRREIWILRQILKEMKELVLFIELFNRCFPFCIFAWKIYSLSLSILCYFFVIRHSEDFPLLALFFGYGAIALTVIYMIMYEHAFSIPGKMEELKNEFLLTAQKTTTTTKASASTANGNRNGNGIKNILAEMRREIKRIHGVGIKVGSFHQMERESTPNFINFVINQVVSLLVTVPR